MLCGGLEISVSDVCLFADVVCKLALIFVHRIRRTLLYFKLKCSIRAHFVSFSGLCSLMNSIFDISGFSVASVYISISNADTLKAASKDAKTESQMLSEYEINLA